MNRRSLGRHVLVLALYVVAAMAIFAPLIPKIETHTPGRGYAWHYGDDQYYLWQMWWTKTALVDQAHPLWQTDQVFYPAGVDLRRGYDAIFATLVSVPLQRLTDNLILIYNVVTLGSLVASAYGAYLLARYVTKRDGPSWIAGLIFGFTPYLIARTCCHLNMVSAEFIPIFLLAVLKALESKQWRWVFLAGLSFAFVGLGSWIYFIGSGLLLVVVMIWRGFRHDWHVAFMRTALIGVVGTLLVSPFMIPAFQASNQSPLLMTNEVALRDFSLDLTSFFVPIGGSVMDLPAVQELRKSLDPSIEQDGYLGTIEIGIAVVVLMVWLRRRRTTMSVGLWVSIFATFVVLSLGPVLKIARVLTLPLPGGVILQIPPFSYASSPSRYVLFGALALGMIVAIALARWTETMKKRHPRRYLALVALIALSLLAERLPAVDASSRRTVPSYVNELRTSGEPGAVLDLPLGYGLFVKSMQYQTIHQRPIVGGYVQRHAQTAQSRSFIETDPVLLSMLCNDWYRDTGFPDPSETTDRFAKRLQTIGVAYVIVHQRDYELCEFYRPEAAAYTKSMLRGVEPIIRAGEDLVYRVADLVEAESPDRPLSDPTLPAAL